MTTTIIEEYKVLRKQIEAFKKRWLFAVAVENNLHLTPDAFLGLCQSMKIKPVTSFPGSFHFEAFVDDVSIVSCINGVEIRPYVEERQDA